MKIFVAGGTGVIGRRAVALLAESGHDVSVIARSDEKSAFVRELGGHPVTVSLFDAAELAAAVVGHDVVINLATHIPSMMRMARMSAWAENDRIRIEGSRNLVDAALAAGSATYIQESLAFLYAAQGDRWIDESAPQVADEFTVGAEAAKREANRFTAAGRTGVILRFGQFYAADSTHSQSMVGFARWGRAMMPGDPDGYVVTIAADDAASAVVAALDVPAGTYNIVDEPITRREWAIALAHGMGTRRLKLPPRFIAKIMARKAPNLVGSQRVSNAAFHAATGWAPRFTTFREGAHLLVTDPFPPGGVQPAVIDRLEDAWAIDAWADDAEAATSDEPAPRPDPADADDADDAESSNRTGGSRS